MRRTAGARDSRVRSTRARPSPTKLRGDSANTDRSGLSASIAAPGLDLAAASSDATRHDFRPEQDGARRHHHLARLQASLDLDELTVAVPRDDSRLVHAWFRAHE